MAKTAPLHDRSRARATRSAPLPRNFADDFRSVIPQRHTEYRPELPTPTYENTFITHSGIALRRLRLIRESLWDNIDPQTVRKLYGYALYKYSTEPRIRPHARNLLLLHNHWSGGYHHWLAECLVKVQFVDPSEYAVLLPADYPRFAAQSLALFPFDSVVEVPAGHGVRAARATLVANPNGGGFDPAHLAWLRRHCLEVCDEHEASKGRPQGRLYLTRSSEPIRRVVNEEEVIAALEPYGFEVVDSRALSFCEQVRLFRRCELVVSAHGAGLTNCLFMPKGGRLLELYRELTDEHPGMNPVYWQLVTAAGLHYYYQFCAHGKNSGERIDQVDVIADTELLRRNVEQMLS